MPIARWLVCAAALTSGVFLLTPVHAGETTNESGGPSATTLQWSAPGDDGSFGTAVGYDIRFSRDAITAANFPQAAHLSSLLLPGPAGSKQSFSFTGLTPGVTYYFAVKSVDDKGNWSPISSVAPVIAGTTNTGVPNIAEASFSNPWPNPAKLGKTIAAQNFVENLVMLCCGGLIWIEVHMGLRSSGVFLCLAVFLTLAVTFLKMPPRAAAKA